MVQMLPRTGLEFPKSVFFPKLVGVKMDGLETLDENIVNNDKVIEGTNSSMFIDTLKTKEYNLDMIFKKDRPLLILTDSTNMNFGSGLNMPGGDLKLNFSDSIDFNLDNYHSIILNSN